MVTKDQAQQGNTEDVDAMLDDLDPNDTQARDATHIRAIIAAAKQLEAADAQLRLAVATSRSAGDSWTAIGVALGTTKQAAYQRFGKDAMTPDDLLNRAFATSAEAVGAARSLFVSYKQGPAHSFGLAGKVPLLSCWSVLEQDSPEVDVTP